MKKKVLLLIITVIAMVSAMCLCAHAETFYPDEKGRYTVELSVEAGNEYAMFLLKGEYDQTNYIEAYASSSDEDIIYFGTAISDDNGKAVFGPFAPFEYCNATIIVGGTNLSEPYLAGYVNADGFSSAAAVKIINVDKKCYVNGKLSKDGKDVVIKVATQVFDSFGNPSLTNEKVTISVNDNGLGFVTADSESGEVTVSRMSEEIVFSIIAKTGEVTDTVFVEVQRTGDTEYGIEFVDKDGNVVKDGVYVCSYVDGNAPELTFGAYTVNQFGDRTLLGGTISYKLDGVDSTNTFTPDGTVHNTLTATNDNGLSESITIDVTEIPDYQGAAKELAEMIKAAEKELADVIAGVDGRYVSVDGKDVYPAESWTTPDDVADMEYAISDMTGRLAKYAEESDNYFFEAKNTFNTCCMLFEASFKAGKRVDATSVVITNKDLDKIDMQSKPIALTYKMLPSGNTDVLTWSSSDPSVVSVDENGKISTLSYGTATITATTRLGLTASIDVAVWNEITSLDVTANLTVTYGDPYKSFTAAVYTVDPNYPASAPIVWTVENPEIADIRVSEDGKTCTVIPKSAGATNVVVTADTKTVTRRVVVKLPTDWITPASPVADVEGGVIYKGTKVALSTETSGAKIYYTLNGEEPTAENARLYRGPIAINQSLTLKAFATGEKMFGSEVVTYEYTVVSPALVMENVSAQAGETVDVEVSFVDNPGVDNIAFAIEYDTDYFELESTTLGNVTAEESAKDGEYSVSAKALEGGELEGTIVILTFKIKNGTPEADYQLKAVVTTESEDEIYSLIATEGGVITVDNVIVGDADDNGRIEIADVLIIKQYIAGMQAAKDRISFVGADVNADGVIDEDDVKLLSKYCVGWDVTLGAKKKAGFDNLIIPTTLGGEKMPESSFDPDYGKQIFWVYAYVDGETKYIPVETEEVYYEVLDGEDLADVYADKLCTYEIKDGFYVITPLEPSEDTSVLDGKENEDLVMGALDTAYFTMRGNCYYFGLKVGGNDRAVRLDSSPKIIIRVAPQAGDDEDEYDYKVLTEADLPRGLENTLTNVQYVVANNESSKIRENLVVFYAEADEELRLAAEENNENEGNNEDKNSYRIVKNFDYNKVEDGRWINIYELYNPATGEVETQVPGTLEAAKASGLTNYVKSGSLIRLTEDGKVEDVVSKQDDYIIRDLLEDTPEAYWVADYNETKHSITLVPTNDEVCRQCVAEYVESACSEDITVEDLMGNTVVDGNGNAVNELLIGENTSVVYLSYSDYATQGFFKWGSMDRLNASVFENPYNDYFCYNKRALNENGGFIKDYSDFIKVWVASENITEEGELPTADFVIILVHDAEPSASNGECTSGKHN